jgi:hypothetical protein
MTAPCSRQRRLDAVGEGGVVGDEDRLGELVVLGLGEEIDRDQAGIVGGIGEDDDLGGAGDGIDADAAEDLPLGLGDIGIAGADDAIDGGDGSRAIGEGRHGLGAADAVGLGDAGEAGGGGDEGGKNPARAGHGHDDARNPGDAGGDRVHQHGGGVGGLAAGDIDADGVERAPAEAHADSGLVGQREVGGKLAAMESLDPLGGEAERGVLGLGDGLGGGKDLGGADPELGGGEIEPVEAAREVAEGGVAVGADGLDDGGDRGLDRGGLAAGGSEEGGEGGFEAGCGG